MKSVLSDKRIIAAGMAVFCMALTAPRSHADGGSVVPSKTTVLILPVLDDTGEGRMAGLHQAVVTHLVEYELLARQFTVIGPTLAKTSTQSANVSLTDTAARTSDNLKKLADAAGADWVISFDVLEVKHDTLTPGNRTDHAKMHILVYDNKTGSILADKDVLRPQNSGGQNIGVLGLMIDTISNAAQYSLKNLLAPYPETVKVDDEEGTEDYLIGQTKSVTGDPNKLFTAVAAPPPSSGTVEVN